MELKVETEPCMLYETIELLYTYVNQLPLERLTAKGDYCIPLEEIPAMMEASCTGLDRKDATLMHFFSLKEIQGEPNQFTCLASCMAYFLMNVETTDTEAQINRICKEWDVLRRSPYTIRAINCFTLDIEELPANVHVSLMDELRKLPIDQTFFLELLETFSDFTYQMDQLQETIAPVAARLRGFLEPYVQRADELRQEWLRFFEHETVETYLEKRSGTVPESRLEQAVFVLRYLNPRYAPGRLDSACDHFWSHLGVAVKPTLQPSYQKRSLNDQEFAAFRLLGDKGRSDIIQALADRTMSMQELATHLHVNPGTVFRNLNSLSNAELISKEIRGDRYYYKANLDYIETIFRHVLEFYNSSKVKQQNLPS